VAVSLAVLATAVFGIVLVAGAVGVVTGGLGTPGAAGATAGLGGAAADPGRAPVVPAKMAALYEAAAGTCPGLPAAVLAAIGTVESGNGTSDLPGVRSGANAAGAEGPMQFLPATFAEYALPVPPGGIDPANPYDPVDAVYAAARLLCANGASGGLNLSAAVYAYNHSTAYVAEVLTLAAELSNSPP
jgi:membrane-bound lytic murein transglycosylase B